MVPWYLQNIKNKQNYAPLRTFFFNQTYHILFYTWLDRLYHIKPEIIGHIWNKVKSIKRTKINMRSTRLFYQIWYFNHKIFPYERWMKHKSILWARRGNSTTGSKLMGNLWSSGKMDKCKVTISFRKYTWVSKQINCLCTWISNIIFDDLRAWL